MQKNHAKAEVQPTNKTVTLLSLDEIFCQGLAGARLKQVLQHWPEELLKMASCPSAILIGKMVNPSEYVSHLRFIVLNPKYFAVTDSEKATFQFDKDPRHSAFDTAPFRRTFAVGKTKLSNEILNDVSAEERDMILKASRVLIHELAHACDLRDLLPETPSDKLAKLPSNNVQKYADVYLKGRKQLEAEVQGYQLTDFVNTLMSESAIDYYSHYSHFEHFAMLVEAFLMKHYFGAEMHSLFTAPYKTGTPRAEQIVRLDLANKVCTQESRTAALEALQVLGIFSEDFSESLTDCEVKQTPLDQALSVYALGQDILVD